MNLLFIHIPKTGGVSIQNSGAKMQCYGHTLAKDIPDINDYFSFTFVRNPYDRLVSTYYFYLYQYEKIKKKNLRPIMRQIRSFGSFASFVEHLDEVSDIQIIPQSDFITKDVDFIGAFENLKDDWEFICHVVFRNPIELTRMNASNHPDWQELYTDKLRRIVYEKYERDFVTLNYDG